MLAWIGNNHEWSIHRFMTLKIFGFVGLIMIFCSKTYTDDSVIFSTWHPPRSMVSTGSQAEYFRPARHLRESGYGKCLCRFDLHNHWFHQQEGIFKSLSVCCNGESWWIMSIFFGVLLCVIRCHQTWPDGKIPWNLWKGLYTSLNHRTIYGSIWMITGNHRSYGPCLFPSSMG